MDEGVGVVNTVLRVLERDGDDAVVNDTSIHVD